MTLALSLEHTDRPLVKRVLIWNNAPNRRLEDVAEADITTLNMWVVEFYPNVRYVRMPDGSFEEPDCLTVFEAAEASMAPTE